MTALRPIYTDNLMHDLKTERFFKPEMINDINEVGDGAVKTFPRGIKDSPVPVGNLIRLASEAESRNVSIL
jgi:hypothetical protein